MTKNRSCRSHRAGWTIATLLVAVLTSCSPRAHAQTPTADGELELAQPATDATEQEIESSDATQEGSGTSIIVAEQLEVVAEPAQASEPTTVERMALVQTDIDALEALLGGTLPAEFVTQTLFEVDLTSPSAIDVRIAELEATLAAAPEARAALVERLLVDVVNVPATQLGTGVGTGDGTGVGTGDGTGAGSTDQTGFGTTEGSGAPPGADVTTEPIADDFALFDLQTERDRLRLAFLTRSQAMRATVIQAEQERRQIDLEQQSAAAAADQAQAQVTAAEEAQLTALEQARTTASTLERDLLTERARVESLRAELARMAADTARLRQSLADEASERLNRKHELEMSLLQPALSGAQVDEVYDRVVYELVGAREQLGQALDDLRAGPTLPEYDPHIDLTSRVFLPFPEERTDLGNAVSAFQRARRQVLAEDERLRWDRTAALADAVHQFNDLRLRLLPRLSRSKRDAVLGLGHEGIAQLLRELDQVQLMARWWWHKTIESVKGWPRGMASLVTQSTLRWNLALFLAVMLSGAVGYRRRAKLWLRLRSGLMAKVRENRFFAFLAPRWSVFRSVAGEVLFLLFLFVSFGLAGSLTDSAVLQTVRSVLVTYAVYRLIVVLIHQFLLQRFGRAYKQKKQAERILRSIHLAGRYAFGALVVLIVSEPILGRGYLYGLVVNFAWIGFFPIAFLLLRRWHSEIRESYLSRFPSGLLVKPWRRHPGGPVGYLLTIPTTGRLVALAVVSEVRKIAFRFEKARRALVYLSRRRLEKQAESVGRGVTEVSDLPEDLRKGFEQAAFDAEFKLDYYPQIDRFTKLLKKWSDGGPGFAVALCGERGIGKTSWMNELVRRVEGVEASLVEVPNGPWTEEQACVWFSKVVGVTTSRSIDDLVEHVEEKEVRRVIQLDLCQNLMLRAVGGTAGFETLVELTARTHDQLVWVCSFSQYAWLYLKSVQQTQNLFRYEVSLPAWPEEAIANLIRNRMEHYGYEMSFKDLLVGHLEGTALDNAIVQTSEEYLRLLWDYADGNPRIAIHFWLHSLIPAGEKLVRVRLFEAPPLDELENLHEQSRFMLAAVILHENLTIKEASLVLRYSAQDCAALFAFLEAHGFIESDEHQRFRVTPRWYRAVTRHLSRKRLLF